jgi:hypothetical protein
MCRNVEIPTHVCKLHSFIMISRSNMTQFLYQKETSKSNDLLLEENHAGLCRCRRFRQPIYLQPIFNSHGLSLTVGKGKGKGNGNVLF